MIKSFFIIASLLIASNAFAGGTNLSELKKESKIDDAGKLFLTELHDLNAPHAINPVSLSDKSIFGDKSFRFEVNHGECGQAEGWSDCENERERSELYFEWKDNQFGAARDEKWKREKWYRFYLFVPKGFNSVVPAKTSLIQWKRRRPSRVIIMFQYHKGGLLFNLNGDTFAKDQWYLMKKDKELRGQWTEILFNTNWHPDADKGYMKVWIDGEMKFDYKGKANDDVKGKELNLRFGIYNSFLNKYRKVTGNTTYPQRVVYFDGVKGDTTCEKLLKDQTRCDALLAQTMSMPIDYHNFVYGKWSQKWSGG